MEPDVANANRELASVSGRVLDDGHRKDIQGLRTLAVGLVVAFHFGLTALPGGFVGVDVFFVISGYLITEILVREASKTGTVNLLSFYAKRSRRLLPAALLVTVVTLIASAIILAPAELAAAAKAAVTSSLYFSNFWFMKQSFDYFSPESALNPFLHTWSLSVEEQFYVVWPTFVLLASKFLKTRRAFLLAMIGILVTSFIACVWLTQVRQPWAFYASPLRAWEFALGALAGQIAFSRTGRHQIVAYALGWIGLATVVGSALIFTEASDFPGWIAMIPAAGTAAMLWAGAATKGKVLSFASWRPITYLGDISYAIYLWHWPIIVLGLIVFPHMDWIGRLLCAALTIGLAAATQPFEHRIRDSAFLKPRVGLSLGLTTVITLAGALVGVGAIVMAGRLADLPTQKAFTTAADLRSDLRKDKGCMLELTVGKPRGCVFGDPKASKSIVLFGDSHAAQWFTPIRSYATEHGANVVTHTKSSCAPADISVYNKRLHRRFTECESWRRAAIAEIIAKRPMLVIMSEFTPGYVDEGGKDPSDEQVDRQQWLAGVKSTVSQFANAGIPVVLISDTPNMGFSVPNCLARRHTDGVCGQAFSIALNPSLAAAEDAALSNLPGAHYLSLNDRICSDRSCPGMRDGTVIYRDNHHLSEKFAVSLEPILADRLNAALSH